MKLDRWIENKLNSNKIKISKTLRRTFEEYESVEKKNGPNVGSASLANGFETLNTELIDLITQFGKLKLIRKKEIINLEQTLKKYVDESSKDIKNFIDNKTHHVVGISPLEEKIKDSYGIIEINCEIINQERKYKLINFWWNTSKIFITAIVAGFIGAYIKEIFE